MYEFRGFLEKPIIQISNVTITCWKGLLQQIAQRKGKSYYLLISLKFLTPVKTYTQKFFLVLFDYYHGSSDLQATGWSLTMFSSLLSHGKTDKCTKRRPYTLTLYALKSVCIFSILFSKHFLGCQHGEFVLQSRSSLVGDQLLYSPDLQVQFRGDMVRRN